MMMTTATVHANNQYDGIYTKLIRVASQPTTVKARTRVKGFNRGNRAIEKAVNRARRALKKQCTSNHQSDAQCNEVGTAQTFDEGRAAIKGPEFRRVCEFGEGKTKIVKRCRTKRKAHRESVAAVPIPVVDITRMLPRNNRPTTAMEKRTVRTKVGLLDRQAPG
ncbi:MAG: hypothetical protein VX589_07670 [Myxococcota bacterium]|nr:hypothetical protein [Myxococcota bacterium]